MLEADYIQDKRTTTAFITLKIAGDYHQEPVISRLISEFGLTVNITAAILGENTKDDGWFKLDLQGTQEQIHNALIYLNDLGLEIWDGKNNNIDEGW
ncbi:ABC-type metal ion transport system, ATPase component [Synechococcus sp. PCC 7502]|uniref:NIL domain-containing protein n=1 Tax=Synechococcus sp. PCC 7502 TaxID=1173263 RepID=UPI00029FE695|nr:NIL domain-containing protein [Synechococcus sp. PCC 7502]AFY72405.1 ABC-type metal ion transport system, ATPase component [Synechococcus sp. PCC 7502]